MEKKLLHLLGGGLPGVEGLGEVMSREGDTGVRSGEDVVGGVVWTVDLVVDGFKVFADVHWGVLWRWKVEIIVDDYFRDWKRGRVERGGIALGRAPEHCIKVHPGYIYSVDTRPVVC